MQEPEWQQHVVDGHTIEAYATLASMPRLTAARSEQSDAQRSALARLLTCLCVVFYLPCPPVRLLSVSTQRLKSLPKARSAVKADVCIVRRRTSGGALSALEGIAQRILAGSGVGQGQASPSPMTLDDTASLAVPEAGTDIGAPHQLGSAAEGLLGLGMQDYWPGNRFNLEQHAVAEQIAGNSIGVPDIDESVLQGL